MKERYDRIGLGKLCGWFGITRQAYYQHRQQTLVVKLEEELIIKEVLSIRASHPRMGVRKLFEKIKPFLQEHKMKIGRDGLFNLLARNNLLIRIRKRRVATTNSSHWLRKYPNLVKEKQATRPNEIWVSDITYWRIKEGHFLYISFITDAYSKRIMGYHVADNLEAVESIKALKKALKLIPDHASSLVHHSDRGVQYCSGSYVKLLQDYGINISMTESGDPKDNAIAERLNGIIKTEYLDYYQAHNLTEAKAILKRVIRLYNEERPHASISNQTPEFVHTNNVAVKKLWKNYYGQKASNTEAAFRGKS